MIKMLSASEITLPMGTFAYLCQGRQDAPVVLCLHGFPDTPYSYMPVMEILSAAGYRTIAPWLRGYAPSTRIGPFSLERIAADVILLAQSFSPKKPVFLVGHDWGAMASYQALIQSPQTFTSAVTLSVPHPVAFFSNLFTNPKQWLLSWYILFFQLAHISNKKVYQNNFAFIDKLWRTWSPSYQLKSTEMRHIKECLAKSMPAPLEYYRSLFWPPKQFLQRLKTASTTKISVPTLYLHGVQDGCIHQKLGRGQKRFFLNKFQSKTIKNAGHFLQLEQAKDVGREILDWFSRTG